MRPSRAARGRQVLMLNAVPGPSADLREWWRVWCAARGATSWCRCLALRPSRRPTSTWSTTSKPWPRYRRRCSAPVIKDWVTCGGASVRLRRSCAKRIRVARSAAQSSESWDSLVATMCSMSVSVVDRGGPVAIRVRGSLRIWVQMGTNVLEVVIHIVQLLRSEFRLLLATSRSHGGYLHVS